ncbi:hypothetical protein HWV23_06160 [Natronomonas halophila]|uniref:DUF7118 family protein n=1 Tax=Natronomonas halophila TaxID=2747817 RepID=UPI0015B6B5DE|nr:hypothetical protein [Natronomonas halophila]QLD85327.1 hypothetical protein HWV23_06160 [Natronomonas halophila]
MSDVAAELREACETVHEYRDRADDHEHLDEVADAYESVERVLDRWEERATDWDDFEGYMEFRNDISETLESIPEDVPESDAFVEADRHVKTKGVSKSLDEGDFEAAREALSPAAEYAELREDLEAAETRYRKTRQRAKNRLRELGERIDDLERLVELGEADLDAPVEELREPVERYNEAVREDFAAFRRDESAREFLGWVETAAASPLVDYEAPSERLLEYVRERPAGEQSVPDLLEYADYSQSKLSHYVEDADRLKRRVATNRTYLEGLSADPLCIGWPTPPADTLRFLADELVSVVGRFADEETVAALREVRALTRRDDYGRLQTAAVARAEMTEEERERVASGAVAEELEATREEKERIEAALEDCDI